MPKGKADPEPSGRERTQSIETLYVESSALLRWLLEGDPIIGRAFKDFERIFTSALTLVEVPRALARARRESRLSQSESEEAFRRLTAFTRACAVAEIGRAVRRRAALEFPAEPVRSLDAIHLATIIEWSDDVGPLVVLSTDERIRRNARTLGYEVLPV